MAITTGAALLGSAVLGAASASKASSAAKNAASTSAKSADYAADLQKEMYDQTREDQTPWREAGTNALGWMKSGMGADGVSGDLTRNFGMSDFQTDPGYQFRMDQGTNALQGAAAAKGGLKSGNTLKALMEYGQNLGSQEYGNAYNRFNTDQNTQFNRLASVAGLGQTANSALQSAGTNYANSVGNLMTNSAANQGNAMLAGANARSSSYNAIGQAAGNYFGNYGSKPGMASYDQNNVTTGFGYGEPLDWGW